MTRFPSSYDRPAFVASLGIGLVGALALVLMGHHPNDDAYILFRHAAHVAEHFALRWNMVGDPELGTHAGYTSLLALVSFVSGSGDIPQVAHYLNVALLFVCGPLFYLIARDITGNVLIALAASLVICLNSYNVRIYSQGFEALSFVVVFFACLYLFARERYALAICLASIAPLIRPEGIWLSVLGVVFLATRRVWRPVFLAIYGAVPVGWLVFSISYYGHFLPQSMQAKRADMILRPLVPLGTGLGDRIQAGLGALEGVWDILIRPVLLINGEAGLRLMTDLPYQSGNFFLQRGNAILYAMILVALVAGVRLYLRGDWRRVLYCSYPLFLAVFVVYTIRLEFWYLPVFVCSALLLIVTGFYHLFALGADFVRARNFALGSVWPGALATGLGLVVAGLMLGKNMYVINDGTRPYDAVRGPLYVPAPRDNVEFERYAGYRRAANILNEYPPGMAMANEIGVFGYYYKGAVLDTFGLCSKATVAVLEEAHATGQDYDRLLVVRLKPDYIMGGRFKPEYPDMYRSFGYRLIYTDPDYQVFGWPLDIWVHD